MAAKQSRESTARIKRTGARGAAPYVLILLLLLLFAAAVQLLLGTASLVSMTGGVLLHFWGLLWPILFIASAFWKIDRWPIAGASSAEGAQPPLITILAPARNEAPVVGKLVQTYLDQNYHHWQLLVLANNCTDDTADVARAAAKGDPRVEVLEMTFDNGVKSDALNRALPFAKGDVILEMDADNELPQGYLQVVADAFADPDVDAVQSQIRANNGHSNMLAAFQDLEFLVYSEVWNRGRASLGLCASIGGTGFAIRPWALEKLGGWSRDLVEDYELHTRLVDEGIEVKYLGAIKIYDEKPVSWAALIKQRRRWIRGHLEVAARRSRSKQRMGLIDEMYLYSPVVTWLSMVMFVMGWASVFFPDVIGAFAYFSPWFWLMSLLVMTSAISIVVIRARDWYLLPFVLPYLLLFTYHWIIVFILALFPVQWSATKTVHGVEAGKGFLAWLGVDDRSSARTGLLVASIALAWFLPLCTGLTTAPAPTEAPLLWGGRSIADVAVAVGQSAGTVEGFVRDQANRPLPGASVSLTNLDTGMIVSATTNSRGEFSIAALPVASYRAVFSKSGLRPAAVEFELTEGRSVRIDAVLVPSGASGAIIVPRPY